MTQSAEHVAKRAAAMRGKARPNYTKPDQLTPAQIAYYQRMKDRESVLCPNGCGTLMRPGGGTTTHIKRCGRMCILENCDSTVPGALGYCSLHYRILKNVREHGLTVETYLDLYNSQSGRCKSCGVAGTYKGQQIAIGQGNKNSVLCIDHDHDTGRVRGLLCHPCNIILGLAKDDSTRLRNLADYLEIQ